MVLVVLFMCKLYDYVTLTDVSQMRQLIAVVVYDACAEKLCSLISATIHLC